MIKTIFFTFISTLILTLNSCKELTGASTGANNTVEELTSEKELIGNLKFVELSSNKFRLAGTMDNSGDSGHHFRLKFELPEAESLEFFFFANNDLNRGVYYKFTRTNGAVSLFIKLNKSSDSFELKTFKDSEIIDLDLDIHNDHTDIHLFVWDYNGEHQDSDNCSFNGGCLYNNEDFVLGDNFEPGPWSGAGRAQGTYWGFKGDKSLILELSGPNPGLSDA